MFLYINNKHPYKGYFLMTVERKTYSAINDG